MTYYHRMYHDGMMFGRMDILKLKALMNYNDKLIRLFITF